MPSTVKKSLLGRSIEEVLVRRRAEDESVSLRGSLRGSSSLPTLVGPQSQSQSGLNRGNVGPGINGGSLAPSTFFHEQNVLLGKSKSQGETKPKEKDPLVESLVDYCKTLQNRINELESQLHRAKESSTAREMLQTIQARQMQSQHHQHQHQHQHQQHVHFAPSESHTHLSHSPPNTSHDHSSTKHLRINKTLPGEVKDSMGEIDLKVLYLKELFRRGDPIEERHQCATKIAACIRGFTARARYRSYQKGLREWKWQRCRQVIFAFDAYVRSFAYRHSQWDLMLTSLNMRRKALIFMKWAFLVRQTAPLRRNIMRRAEDKGLAKDKELLGKVFAALKSVCVGHLSVKNANHERRLLIDSIREEMSNKLKAQGEIGIVLDSEVISVLYRRVLDKFLSRKRQLTMMNLFKNGFVVYMKMLKKYNRWANEHWFQTRAGKCFYAWSDHVYMVAVGLDRKRWKGPRKYEVRYHQKRVDNWSRLRQIKYVFKPWKEYIRILHNVKRCYQRQVARFVRANFLALRTITKAYRRLRELTVNNWRSYARLMTQGPFYAWAGHVRSIKNHNSEQDRIVTKYCKWKQKQWITLILRTWRHQALYGRIDGMYTRQMLVKSLGEQKQMTTSLERMMAAQTVQLEECQDMVEREIMKRKELEKRLTASGQEVNKFKMVSHHVEQELRRVEAVVESMALINPRQVEHLKLMQPNFKFKVRKIVLPKERQEGLLVNDEDGEDGEEEAEGDDDSKEESNKKKSKVKKRPSTDDSDGEMEGGALSSRPSTSQGIKDTDEGSGLATNLDKTSAPPAAAGTTAASSSTSSTAPTSSGQQGVPDSSSAQALPLDSTSVPIENAYPANLSLEDLVLLDRAKWLVSRFKLQVNTENPLPPDAAALLATDGSNPNPNPNPDPNATTAEASATTTATSAPTVAVAAVAPPPAPQPTPAATTTPSAKNGKSAASNEADISTAQDTSADSGEGGENAPNATPAPPPVSTPSRPVIIPSWISLDNLSSVNHDAASMLLSLCDFLENGDVTGFAPEDRRDWTKHVLASVRPPATDEAVDDNGVPKLSVSQEALLEEATDIVITRTWRDTLMGLRTLYPGAGNYSGVGKELDSTNSDIFVRIIDMKNKMLQVMKTQEALYHKGEQKMLLEAGGSVVGGGGTGSFMQTSSGLSSTMNGNEEDRAIVPLNIYASNVDAMIRANDPPPPDPTELPDDSDDDFVLPDD